MDLQFVFLVGLSSPSTTEGGVYLTSLRVQRKHTKGPVSYSLRRRTIFTLLLT